MGAEAVGIRCLREVEHGQTRPRIDGNGPAPDLEPRFTGVEILESIAVVRLEVERWSGKLAGSEVHMSDAFTLVKTDDGWKIAHKIFHWHVQ